MNVGSVITRGTCFCRLREARMGRAGTYLGCMTSGVTITVQYHYGDFHLEAARASAEKRRPSRAGKNGEVRVITRTA